MDQERFETLTRILAIARPQGRDWALIGVALLALVVGLWLLTKVWRILVGLILCLLFVLLIKFGFVLLQRWLP